MLLTCCNPGNHYCAIRSFGELIKLLFYVSMGKKGKRIAFRDTLKNKKIFSIQEIMNVMDVEYISSTRLMNYLYVHKELRRGNADTKEDMTWKREEINYIKKIVRTKV